MTKVEQPDVVWDEIQKRFRAYLAMDGERQFLGCFQTLEDAAIARKQQARLYVDSFACDGSRARPVFGNDPDA